MMNNPCYTLCVVWCVNQELQKQVTPFLRFLEDRFRAKIEFNRYVLSYSGGKDSHFLYWFIKEWMKDDSIEIVGVNTSFEIPEIRDRIMRNSDVVLHPSMNRWKIKEQFGIPCFSKQQDEYIHRYSDNNYAVYIDVGSGTVWHSGLVSNYVYSKYPITMPYYPNSKPYKVYCEDFLYKKPDAVGEYDHKALLYMIKPDGEREEINAYYMEQGDWMVEIDPQTYYKHREETFG